MPIESEDLITRYAEIDAFSQGKSPYKGQELAGSARNMGKNVLWIASTASVTEAVLVTADEDFLHLDPLFLSLALFRVCWFYTQPAENQQIIA